MKRNYISQYSVHTITLWYTIHTHIMYCHIGRNYYKHGRRSATWLYIIIKRCERVLCLLRGSNLIKKKIMILQLQRVNTNRK